MGGSSGCAGDFPPAYWGYPYQYPHYVCPPSYIYQIPIVQPSTYELERKLAELTEQVAALTKALKAKRR